MVQEQRRAAGQPVRGPQVRSVPKQCLSPTELRDWLDGVDPSHALILRLFRGET